MQTGRRQPFPTPTAALDPTLWHQTRLAWRLFRDPRVSRFKNLLPVLAGLYVLSPIDLLPDLLPGIGQVDDLGVLGLLLVVIVQLLPKIAPRAVVREHLAAMGLVADFESPPDRSDGRVYDAAYRVRSPKQGAS